MILQFLTGIYLMFNIAFQSCNDIKYPYDWSIEMELRKNNSVYVSIEKQRLMDKEYLNYELWFTFPYKFLEGNVKTLRLDCRDVTIYQTDIRGIYKNWSAGIGEYWDNGIPSTRFFFGKRLDFNIKFFLFPIELSFRSDVSTSDFKTYNHEENLWLTFDFISFMDLYCKAEVKDYGYLRWKTRFGIKFNL